MLAAWCECECLTSTDGGKIGDLRVEVPRTWEGVLHSGCPSPSPGAAWVWCPLAALLLSLQSLLTEHPLRADPRGTPCRSPHAHGHRLGGARSHLTPARSHLSSTGLAGTGTRPPPAAICSENSLDSCLSGNQPRCHRTPVPQQRSTPHCSEVLGQVTRAAQGGP